MKVDTNLNVSGPDPLPGLLSKNAGMGGNTPLPVYGPKNREAASDYPPYDLRAKIFRPLA